MVKNDLNVKLPQKSVLQLMYQIYFQRVLCYENGFKDVGITKEKRKKKEKYALSFLTSYSLMTFGLSRTWLDVTLRAGVTITSHQYFM